MSTPSEVLRRLAEEVISGGDLAAIDELVAEDYTDHTGAGGRGPQTYREIVQNVRAVFSDMRMTLEDVVESGDKAAARFRVTAVHAGEFMGVPATGRRVSWEGIGIIRVVDGKMAERWNVSDLLGIVEQITREDPE